ncbi:uncharacterized protein RHIMIDRAFT_72764 [Rhizopus microsporus ATCC 52813]|uniref:Uncharacterized protein n=1 Tax=Rhizopus microsporus ATCC 52813 TaxID=1340429 RepID=A0A2G4SJ96_RHIZD|nr:uncharacterized protein RHIMIDRAFT_72764 [Rhizopus microsporus ATCC 52813]PHZ08466.1 hypothetical protein RHIMIDRAFT_72764 [Rhizopus microsporus ATCC 52813]
MMRTVTIKQQQQMIKESEEQLRNGRLNYLEVVNDYCYWMGWNKLCSMGRVMKGMCCLMYSKDNNIHTQERIFYISRDRRTLFFSLFLPTNKSGKARINSKGEMKG